MGGRSRSYSPRRVSRSRSPPRRKHYDDPRDRRLRGGGGGGGGRAFRDRRSAPSGLLIRNISLDAKPEDLKVPFERFGPVRDVYLPRNYYTREPRGFGFVKFRNAEDAAEAKYEMNHQVICGREISIVFADENRKTPQEMRFTGRISERHGGGRRRSPRRHQSYSRSSSPRHDSRGRGRGTWRDYSPQNSLTPPRGGGEYGSDQRSPTPKGNGRNRSRSRSPMPKGRGRSPSGSRSPIPKERGRSPSRSRSYSPR